jgi:hypothetical protein
MSEDELKRRYRQLEKEITGILFGTAKGIYSSTHPLMDEQEQIIRELDRRKAAQSEKTS